MTVEEYLDNVDYDKLKNYIPSDEALEFVNFMHLATDGKQENLTPPVHLYALDQAFKDSNPTTIMCHRGFAKTTLFGEMLILYAAAFGKLPIKDFGKVNFIIYIGDSIENGVKSLRKNIEYRYNNSTFLQRLIPNKSIKYTDENGNEDESTSAGRKFTDVRMEFINTRGDHLVVRLFGAKTGVRGAKELGSRPQVAIIDDIVSDEDARSDTIISSIEDTIHKAVKYALHPSKQKILWLGTPFNAKDPLYKAVESGAYNVACFPVCEKFPCDKDEFKGSWEDRFNYEYVYQAYNTAVRLKKPQSFYQELMLQIVSDEDKLLSSKDITWFDRVDVLKNRSSYNFYITTDLATSQKKNADYSVISVWAINSNGDYMLVDGSCERRLVDVFIDDLFRKVQIYKPLGVGIEVSGQQGGFIRWLTKEMVNKNIWFNLVSSQNNGEPGIRPIGDKFARFQLFLPQIKAGKMWFAKEMKKSSWMNECMNEFDKATTSGFKSKHDDVLDTISMLGSFEVYKPIATWNDEPELNPFIDDFDKPNNTMF